MSFRKFTHLKPCRKIATHSDRFWLFLSTSKPLYRFTTFPPELLWYFSGKSACKVKFLIIFLSKLHFFGSCFVSNLVSFSAFTQLKRCGPATRIIVFAKCAYLCDSFFCQFILCLLFYFRFVSLFLKVENTFALSKLLDNPGRSVRNLESHHQAAGGKEESKPKETANSETHKKT